MSTGLWRTEKELHKATKHLIAEGFVGWCERVAHPDNPKDKTWILHIMGKEKV